MQPRASTALPDAPRDAIPLALLPQVWRFIYQRTGLSKALDQLVAALLKTPEPQAIWKSDRYGEPYLEIYDPTTEKFYYFPSEQEALIWLERRFQQFL